MSGTSDCTIRCAKSFDDRRLPDARFADQHGIIFGPAAEDLEHAFDFVGPADHGIELAFLCHLGQVASELIERRRVAFPVAFPRRRLPEEGHGQLACGQEIGAEAAKDLAADAFFFTQQAQ